MRGHMEEGLFGLAIDLRLAKFGLKGFSKPEGGKPWATGFEWLPFMCLNDYIYAYRNTI